MPLDGSSYNPGPQRQPINGELAAMNAAANAFLKANRLPADTPCTVTLAAGVFPIPTDGSPLVIPWHVTVDHAAAAENERIIAARRQAGG
jgi:hypothetical protein